MTCKALTTEDTLWTFCPSMAASILFFALFVGTTLAHIFQAIRYRKLYCWVVIVSALWQVGTYFFRTLSIRRPDSFGAYAAWFILILVGPIWTNAFAYMVFGRMVWNYADKTRVWGIRAWMFGLIFVLLDVLAFVIQIFGAIRASGQDISTDDVLAGLHIYMIGCGVQLFFILLFSVFAMKLFTGLRRGVGAQVLPKNVLHLFAAEMISLFLIVVRIIFRLAEYSKGLDSSIPNHEAYQYALDSLPMLVALVVFNFVHPGRVMHGKAGDMPPAWKQGKRSKNLQPTAELVHLHHEQK